MTSFILLVITSRGGGLTSWTFSDLFFYVSSSFLYLPGPVIRAVDPSCLAPKSSICCSRVSNCQCTPVSMNSLFREFWRGIVGGVRDYLGEMLGGF